MAIDPFDRNTWPAGDRLWDFARAIACAEGYGALLNGEPNNPTRLCNPGDISDGFETYGGEAHSGSNVTRFPDHDTGWKWLYEKLDRCFHGKSMVYSPAMTFEQFAKKYAGAWSPWLMNVTRELKTRPDQTLESWWVSDVDTAV